MHPQTLKLESADASTDYILNRSMRPPTLYTELVDASTDSIYRVGRCIHRLYIQSRSMHPQTLYTELVNASTDSCFRVGRCIHRPMKYGLLCRLSTDCNVIFSNLISRAIFLVNFSHISIIIKK